MEGDARVGAGAGCGILIHSNAIFTTLLTKSGYFR